MARDDGLLLPEQRLDQSPSRRLRSPLSIQDGARPSHLGAGAPGDTRRGKRGEAMNFDRVEKIAEAVLYEGYMLYPYRPSSVKNQQRWNFGVLCPTSYSAQQQATERDTMQ